MNDIIIEHFSPPSDENRLAKILTELDDVFLPKLSGRVNINAYAKKLANSADIFFVKKGNEDIGNCAVYLNNAMQGFISSIAIKQEYTGMKLGKKLWMNVNALALSKGISLIGLKVFHQNYNALAFYKYIGFDIVAIEAEWIIMLHNEDITLNTNKQNIQINTS